MTVRPPEDLTARARIRDAAMEVFAERGWKAATVRAIAERAGVSPALLQHHFGTKEQLRAACDDHVLDYLRQGVTLGIDQGQLGRPAFSTEIHRSAPSVVRYLVRALVDGSPGSALIFERIVELTVPYLKGRDPNLDPKIRAAVFVAMRLGLVVLGPQLSTLLGTELLSEQGARTAGAAMLDIFDPELFDASITEQARQAVRTETAEEER
ncbi:TetR/AcrR family transcriptional regulator [Microlunatus parietis]|uniref:AcrR family transcriptional regulator n=1 Tax=Microlunatus parietis TaxID=682979 RepID=A0A7Y9I7E4_9ACTN|nr:TetR family transcriptional regulator [Microlunatus parietis]NYE71602.1 AcrR family transcriptional regulator [Microlunatus parietis]